MQALEMKDKKYVIVVGSTVTSSDAVVKHLRKDGYAAKIAMNITHAVSLVEKEIPHGVVYMTCGRLNIDFLDYLSMHSFRTVVCAPKRELEREGSEKWKHLIPVEYTSAAAACKQAVG